MRYFDLFEGRDYPIYHFMYVPKAMNIFENDLMPAKWEHNIPQIGMVKGNSFSRNNNFRMNVRPIRLTMDHSRLAQSHKIIPLDGEYVFRNHPDVSTPERHRAIDRVNGSDNGTQLAEEFVVGDIKNLHRFISKIEIRVTYGVSKFDTKNLVDTVTEYATKFHIPLEISPKVLAYIEPSPEDDE